MSSRGSCNTLSRFALRCTRLLLTGVLTAAVAAPAQHAAPLTPTEEREALHRSPDWAIIAAHLPDPATATAAQLEMAGDVLRARRFPEDALDFYGYAMARGGNVSELLNKMGVLRLELRQYDLAHAMFLRTVRADKKNGQAWNNLGVSDYLNGNFRQAISDYRKAVKVQPRSAIFHSNLGLAYLENKDPESARKQLAQAIKLDPGVLQSRGSGGTMMHVVGTSDYAELCFEMARVYARAQDLPAMRNWLAKASEAGYGVREHMREDDALRAYLKDPQVILLLANADSMHGKNVARAAVPSLGAPAHEEAAR